ncbi:MAG: hypothetical protein ACXACY_29355 [Candidatus Hodarchaeales archaeon]
MEKRLPKISLISGLKIMRRMAKTDKKWISWATRQKNLKEKEKIERQKRREVEEQDKERRKIERERNKTEKDNIEVKKKLLEHIGDTLGPSHTDILKERVDCNFFFCLDVQQFAQNISCIYRVFSNETNSIFNNSCAKCRKMDKYINIIKEVIDGRQERTRKHTPSKGSGKNTKKRQNRKKLKETGKS